MENSPNDGHVLQFGNADLNKAGDQLMQLDANTEDIALTLCSKKALM